MKDRQIDFPVPDLQRISIRRVQFGPPVRSGKISPQRTRCVERRTEIRVSAALLPPRQRRRSHTGLVSHLAPIMLTARILCLRAARAARAPYSASAGAAPRSPLMKPSAPLVQLARAGRLRSRGKNGAARPAPETSQSCRLRLELAASAALALDAAAGCHEFSSSPAVGR